MNVLYCRPNSVIEMLAQYKDRKIFLYGAGNVGGQMLELLRQYDLEPVAFLDRKAAKGQTKDGVMVLRPDDESLLPSRENAVVFVSILLDKEPRAELYENLKALGYLHLQYSFPWIMRNKSPDISWKEEVYKVYDILEDEESRNIYVRNLLALFSDDLGHRFVPPSSEIQYFDKTVPIRKSNMRFVDCGAFTGDTLESLCSNIDNIDAYAGFEPMPSNFKQLTNSIATLNPQIETRLAFPCAVGGVKGVLNFVDASSSSRASKEGVSVPVVRLDDTILAFHPTYIKMDIEGAELDALEGAKQVIIQDKPDLAICVYHAIEHYWAVPLLLRSWVKEYKFYLRTYHFGGMETVLYAVRS